MGSKNQKTSRGKSADSGIIGISPELLAELDSFAADRQGRNFWTPTEEALFMRYQHLTSLQISAIMKKAGYERTSPSIDSKRRRIRNG